MHNIVPVIWYAATSGVPQGSVLGPQLFSTYINDIDKEIISGKGLFADDLLLYRVIRTLEDTTLLQKDLNSVNKWSVSWNLPPNSKKCEVIRITRKRNHPAPVYFIGGNPIPETNEMIHLGITISKDLSWRKHVDKVSGKANRALGLIKRNLVGCGEEVKDVAYKTIVRPLLEFASAVWDPTDTGKIHQLEMVQRRGARFVCGLPAFTKGEVSITDLVKNLKWPTLAERRRKRRLILFYGLVNKNSAALSSLRSALLPAPTQRELRGTHSKQFLTLHARTNVKKHSFLVKTLKDWNNLTEDSVNLDSNSFKAHCT